MGILEIRPSEGGEDSEQFAFELASAVSKSSNQNFELAGKNYIVHCL